MFWNVLPNVPGNVLPNVLPLGGDARWFKHKTCLSVLKWTTRRRRQIPRRRQTPAAAASSNPPRRRRQIPCGGVVKPPDHGVLGSVGLISAVVETPGYVGARGGAREYANS